MIFRELAKGIERRSPVLKPCQELLLLISHTFPILLTHPGTMDAILLSITTNDHNNTTNALKLLKAIREQKIIQHANKKTVASVNKPSSTKGTIQRHAFHPISHAGL